MITFSKLGAYGRLGNQLFQYAALRSLSLKKGYEFKIPNQENMNWHGQKSLMHEFNITAKEYTPQEFSQIKHRYNEPSWRTIDPNFFNLPDDTDFEGFFQSEWYFEEFKDEIIKELTPKDVHLINANDYINDLRSKNQGYEIVALHIRRGNVVTDASMQVVYNKYYEPNGLYFKYLEAAKNIFKNKPVKFLVFSGGAKWDENNETEIEWCKRHLIGDEYLFSEGGEPIEDYARIMNCHHNIMSPASSYGWWAAYTNPNPNKIIVAPKSYLVDEPQFFRYKFYPSNFILL